MNSEPEDPQTWIIQEGRTSGTEAEDCPHDSRQHLGGDAGGNVYYRCPQCEAVLIQQGSVSWKERRATQKEALKEREQGDNPLRGLLESQEPTLFDRWGSNFRHAENSSGSVTGRLRRVIRRFMGR